MPKLHSFPDPQALADAFALRFIAWGRESIAKRGRFRVALSGGHTVRIEFEAIAKLASQLDWSKVDFFWVDERWVPLESPESNAGEAMRIWLDKLPLKPGLQIHPMYNGGEPAAGVTAYEILLMKAFPLGLPFFDLCILGMGPDGHTASLFPGAPALQESQRAVIAVQHPVTGQWRGTLTLASINSSLGCAVLLAGKEKAAALKGVLAGDPALPLSHVRPVYTSLEFFVDQAAQGL